MAVRYFTPEEREAHRVFVRDGLLRSAEDGGLIDTRAGARLQPGGLGRAIFVMDAFGNIYATTREDVARLRHSSLSAGQPVAAAGELVVRDGVVLQVTGRCPQYDIGPDNAQRVLAQLRDEGVDVSGVVVG